LPFYQTCLVFSIKGKPFCFLLEFLLSAKFQGRLLQAFSGWYISLLEISNYILETFLKSIKKGKSFLCAKPVFFHKKSCPFEAAFVLDLSESGLIIHSHSTGHCRSGSSGFWFWFIGYHTFGRQQHRSNRCSIFKSYAAYFCGVNHTGRQ